MHSHGHTAGPLTFIRDQAETSFFKLVIAQSERHGRGHIRIMDVCEMGECRDLHYRGILGALGLPDHDKSHTPVSLRRTKLGNSSAMKPVHRLDAIPST